MKQVTINTTNTLELTVTPDLLAKAVGSGEVAVYATPMMIAAMEQAAATCLKPFLDEGETSVGISISTSHLAATPVGMKVTVTATIEQVDGKKVSFQIVANDEKDCIGKATHDRFVVNQERFEQRANSK